MMEIKEQYEKWVYPEPVFDLDKHCELSTHYHDLKELKPFIENGLGSRPVADVLIAGCGTNQAATHAYRNPKIQYTAIDVSSSSLAHQQFLVSKYKLSNLHLLQLDIRDAHQLNQKFDHIISTGVIHHFADPREPLLVLKSLLRRGGLMNLMVYGKTMRTGVYMIQEAFTRLHLSQNQEDIKLARLILEKHVDHDHPVSAYINRARTDLEYDGGIVDTFLNPVDHSFSVLELLDLLNSCELELASWITPWIYEPRYFFGQTPALLERFSLLEKPQQQQVTDLIVGKIGTHRFLARPHRDDTKPPLLNPSESSATSNLTLHPLCDLIKKNGLDFVDVVSDKTTLGSLPREIADLLEKKLNLLRESEGTISDAEVLKLKPYLDQLIEIGVVYSSIE